MINPLFAHYHGQRISRIAVEKIRPYGSNQTYEYELDGYPLEAGFLKPIFKNKRSK
jgi:hypothetical protein